MTSSLLTCTLTEERDTDSDIPTYSLTDLSEDTFLYHLTLGDVYYSIERLHDSLANAQEHAAELTTDSQTAIAVVLKYTSTATPYAVYSKKDSTSFGGATLSDITGDSTRHIINHYQHIFNGVMSESDSDWHKPIQLHKAAKTIETVQWKQDVHAVAAELLSELLCTHALPNANHRTSLGLMSLYLSLTDSTRDFHLWLPRRITQEPETETLVDKFIVESKRLLTVRRRALLLNYIEQQGFRYVERKNSITIDLSEYQIDVSNYYNHFSDQHRQHCRAFIDELLKTGYSETLSLPDSDPGMRVFGDRAETTNISQSESIGRSLASLRD